MSSGSAADRARRDRHRLLQKLLPLVPWKMCFYDGRDQQKGGDLLRNIKQELNYCPDAAGMRN